MNLKNCTAGPGESGNGGGALPERLAGRLVLDLIMEGLPVNRKTLSGRVAVVLAGNISAEERTGLEIFLRLLLEN